ncbi:MAG: CbrC family protein [Desulfovibrio sp.]
MIARLQKWIKRLTQKPFPYFKYHPDPFASLSMEKRTGICDCCGKETPFIYETSFYAIKRPDTLCPWCIANGKAAAKYNGKFNTSDPLYAAGIPEYIIKKVCERTPGYSSWQEERWLSHCNDACAFHGDAPKHELIAFGGEELKMFLFERLMSQEDWEQLLENYTKGGNPAVYKYKCLKCGKVLFDIDNT